MNHTLTESLRQYCAQCGADAVGFASINGLIPCAGESAEYMRKYPYAVSLAYALSSAVLDSISDHPTKLYFHHYRQVNQLLDQMAIKTAHWIEDAGYRALPVPASQIIDWKNNIGHLSHRYIAREAGIGWIGKNNLIVTPEYGSQVRLVSIMTDMPLEPGNKLSYQCQDCHLCISVCPAQAIYDLPSDFNKDRCYNHIDFFKRKYNLGQHICGLCVRVCKGQRGSKKF